MATPSPVLRLSLAGSRALRAASARAFSSQLPGPRSQISTTPPPTRAFRPPPFRSSSGNNNISPASAPAAAMHTTPPAPRRKPLAHNREEVPDEPPPTDFGRMDVLASAPAPATVVEACLEDGFALGAGGGLRIAAAGGCGALLVGGEAFAWRPWEAGPAASSAAAAAGGMMEEDGKGGGRRRRRRLLNDKGQWEVGKEAFALLGLLWPRPDLLILGLGPEIRPLSPATRQAISDLGMRVEVLDTRNAASQYNLLATERGVDDVAAALIPIGWKEGAE